MPSTRSSSWMWASIPSRRAAAAAMRTRFDCTAPVTSTVSAPRLSFAEVELELAHLVAAEREAGAVVALDPEIDAKRPAKVRRGIERRRRMAEPRPREAGDAGKGTGHDGNRHIRWLLRGSVLACAQTGTLAGRPMQADFAARGDNAAPRY